MSCLLLVDVVFRSDLHCSTRVKSVHSWLVFLGCLMFSARGSFSRCIHSGFRSAVLVMSGMFVGHLITLRA